MGTIILLFLLSFTIGPLYKVSFGLLGVVGLFFLADLFLLYRKSGNVEVSRHMPGIFSLSDNNLVRMKLKNRSQLKLRLEIIDEVPYQFNIRDMLIKTSLADEEEKEMSYMLRPTVRGEYRFGAIRVFVRTRIGLASRKETTHADTDVTVYPSVIQMKQEELAVTGQMVLQGENKSKRIGKSYEFDQLKTYVAGDDPRNINWKASSRSTSLMVNRYEEERSQQVYSVIDKGRVMKMPFNGLTLFDYGVNTSLALSNIALKRHDKAGLITFSNQADTFVKADRSSTQLKKILHALYKSKYNYCESNYEDLYLHIRRYVPNRSLIFLYTNFDSVHAMNRVLPILKMIHKRHLLVVMFFENTELKTYSESESQTIIDIYQHTMARKFIMEKEQIIREFERQGIHAMMCDPLKLSTTVINHYLEIKTRGMM
ncbi:MAG: DUF58 domain-containing protein [Flavobacteriales bacterium]|nr:DUF58 domain-containing protein [Flavobacteriales bacterium]MCB9448995.1 DUF58 domain-containing protein [Flavobacteriales bacterium]